MSSTARGTFEEDQDEEVDFYECQESFEPTDQIRKDDQKTQQPERGKEEKFLRVTQSEDKTVGGLVDKEPSETAGGLVDKEPSETVGGLVDKEPSETAGGRVDEEPSETAGGRVDEEPSETAGRRVDEEPSETAGRRVDEEPSGGQGDEKDLECRGEEFDEDFREEEEKELTEEEKESRRQQSFILKEQGNFEFKAGDWSKAEQSYTAALRLCPLCFSQERAVLFSNRAAARLHLDLKDQAIADCSRAIDLNPDYMRALLRRAELYEQTEKLDEALEDYKKVLDKDPNHVGARQACMRLPQQIHERNEKLKEEMIGKLKDLGNMVLRPFGLSTNNFQVNQDSSTGGYSINFVQNPNGNNR